MWSCECQEQPSNYYRSKINILAKNLQGKYKLRLDKCFKQLNIQSLSDRIDTLFLDSIYLQVNSTDSNYTVWMNVYDKDSLLHYVHYHVGGFQDSLFHKVSHYEY